MSLRGAWRKPSNVSWGQQILQSCGTERQHAHTAEDRNSKAAAASRWAGNGVLAICTAHNANAGLVLTGVPVVRREIHARSTEYTGAGDWA